MTAPIGSTLLIDDDTADNYLHRRVIERSGLCHEITVHDSAETAIEWLATPQPDGPPTPALVFLDINMPGMSGWEFLVAYDQLPATQRDRMVVVMLTASANPADAERAARTESLAGFFTKPLTEDTLRRVARELLGSEG